MEMVSDVYRLTQLFPKHELYGLTNQLRRAAVSIPANISEGSARGHSREFLQYLRISFGSLNELETLLMIARDLNYLDPESYNHLQRRIKLLTAQLSGLIKTIERKTERTT